VSETSYHTPVLIEEICRLAAGRVRIVDCTLGGGGHAHRLVGAGVEFLGIDRDPQAVAVASRRIVGSGVRWFTANFADSRTIAEVARFRPDFVLFDLGVSSYQLDADERGFSFRQAVPLDMRMSAGQGTTAAELLGTLGQRELSSIFREFGDEPRARRLAAAVVRRRQRSGIKTSNDLVNAIREALGPRAGPSDFARLFQALRIAVNDEIGALQSALPAFLEVLEPGGAIAVISYHSGEDRVVKRLFREWASECICLSGSPICTCRGKALGVLDPKKPVLPSAAEVAANPRARSAKLRSFRKAYADQG
jgi:16S rRNA (cytosine1402-N4)-methyltransferase